MLRKTSQKIKRQKMLKLLNFTLKGNKIWLVRFQKRPKSGKYGQPNFKKATNGKI
jgi:hypothetical protein